MGFSNNRVVSANQIEGIAVDRNLISNSDAESGLSGFTQYLGDVNGPNGSFAVTSNSNFILANTTSSPLNLSTSFAITATTTNPYYGFQKQFTPPRKDIKSSANYEISFAYELNSGSFLGSLNEAVASDVAVYIWDDFNSRILPLSTRNLQPMVVGGLFVFKSTFQLPPNGTTFRLCLHKGIIAANFELEIDTIEISLVRSTGVVMRPPVGSIIAHSSATPPSGYLYCNGQTVSRTIYSRLFASIGTTYGTGDGSTTFHVPDFRGRFLRGVDQGINRDPDRASRGAMNTGGASGDNVGSVQTDTFISHSHGGVTGGQTSDHQHIEGFAGVNSGASYGVATAGAPGNINQQAGQSAANHALTSGTTANHAHGISAEGGNETRPENANIAFHICFDDGNSQIAGTAIWHDDVGSVQSFARDATNVPAGFLFCDGAAVSRTVYAELFRAIGTAHGSGDGSTTFNIPDYRGRFLRGQNRSTGRDGDAGSRTAMNSGGLTGDNVGSIQGFAFQSHVHSVNDPGHAHTIVPYGSTWTFNTGSNKFRTPYTTDGNNDNIGTNAVGTGISIGAATGSTSGNETRPLNANVNYFIKFTRTMAPIQVATQDSVYKYTTGSGQSIPNTGYHVINFNTKKHEFGNAGIIVPGVGWYFEALQYGLFNFELSILFSYVTYASSNSITLRWFITRVGQSEAQGDAIGRYEAGAAEVLFALVNGSDDVEMFPGDRITFKVQNNRSGGATTLLADGDYNRVLIKKVR